MSGIRKFEIGDKVNIKNEGNKVYEITGYNYFKNSNAWVYFINNMTSAALTEDKMDIAIPKFKIGDKVICQTTKKEYIITRVEYDDLSLSFVYHLNDSFFKFFEEELSIVPQKSYRVQVNGDIGILTCLYPIECNLFKTEIKTKAEEHKQDFIRKILRILLSIKDVPLESLIFFKDGRIFYQDTEGGKQKKIVVEIVEE